MKTFKSWFYATTPRASTLLSESNLQRPQHQQVQRLYDLATKLLLGAAKDQLHVPLSDISDEAEDGQPPQNKGPRVAMEKLRNAQIFSKLQALGDQTLSARANDAMNWLQKIASDQTIGPKDTVGGLLDRMFGPDSASTYGEHKWKAAAKTPTQAPQDGGGQDPQQATSVSMQQQLTAPQPPMGGAIPGAPMPAPTAAPDPNAMQGVPPPEPDPNDPANPPTTPNGPMPPKPAGGLI